MATMRLYAELHSIGDAVVVAERLAKEGGMRLDAILERAGVTSDDWSAIKALADDRRVLQLRDVLRAVDAMPCIVQASGHAFWRDPHNRLKSAPREPGLLDAHLGDAK
jgi:hypothetical protein